MTHQTITALGNNQEKTAAVRLLVPVQSWTGAKLQSLPGGGSMQIEAQTDGPVRLVMAASSSYKAFPNIGAAVFDRQIEGSLTAEVTLPRGGDYFLIADNRAGTTPRQVLLGLRGKVLGPHDGMELVGQLSVLQRRMEETFDLRGLTLAYETPGPPAPIRIGRKLVVGSDFVAQLESAISDRLVVRGAVLFTIMHGIASDWLDAKSDLPTILPEHLAAALMILFNQLESARRQAAYFSARPVLPETLARAFAEQNHPLSPAIESLVKRRLDAPQTLLRDVAEPILARMRMAALEQLRVKAPDWADPARVAAAVRTRANQ